MYGNLESAMNAAHDICGLEPGHRVLPVTNNNSHLCARLSNGTVIENEGHIDHHPIDDPHRITELFLTPPATLAPQANVAILNADKVVLGPGSFATSIVPNLCVYGMREALCQTKAQLVFVVNITSNDADTREFTAASDHVKRIHDFLGRKLDLVICNDGPISEEAITPYFNKGEVVVDADPENILQYAHDVIVDDFVLETAKGLRHSPQLAEFIAVPQYKLSEVM
jgi:uncharacterized cofD-like protein